jgi:NitT/TauT family transport system permease protein
MSTRNAERELRPAAFRAPAWGDFVVLGLVAAALYLGIVLARHAPTSIGGPEIRLEASALPPYAFRSLGRMAAAYALSLGFTLVYGHLAARRKVAERVLMPLLDVLQSVPILSFLPVVLLSLVAVLPERLAVELAAIVLLFTSQAWNLTFAWYQSLSTEPTELREAAATFRFSGWLRLRALELPHAAIALVWNSMMSWAGGWFFLMAAESFTVGARDFRLPGLGSYLHAAAERGDVHAVTLGLIALVLLIVVLDQLVWRPLIAWSHRFRLETVSGDEAPSSWFLDALRSSRLASWVGARAATLLESADVALSRVRRAPRLSRRPRRYAAWLLGGALAVSALYGASRAGLMLLSVSGVGWAAIGLGLAATLGRVLAALVIAVLWTVPVGVAIGTNRCVAAMLQPLVQIAASIPATALFPVVLAGLLALPFGLDLAAVALMLMGTQWYLLFNVIAGAAAIPEDLRHTSTLMGLRGLSRWRTLVLPSIFPHLITGAVTATGGAWNASIVAEYLQFGGETRWTVGIGALIARATASGDFALLLAATLAMIAAVVLLNRLVWRPLYRLAESRYRME